MLHFSRDYRVVWKTSNPLRNLNQSYKNHVFIDMQRGKKYKNYIKLQKLKALALSGTNTWNKHPKD